MAVRPTRVMSGKMCPHSLNLGRTTSLSGLFSLSSPLCLTSASVVTSPAFAQAQLIHTVSWALYVHSVLESHWLPAARPRPSEYSQAGFLSLSRAASDFWAFVDDEMTFRCCGLVASSVDGAAGYF